MALKYGIPGLILAIAIPLAALAHGPKDLPDDPKLLDQYKQGYAAYQQNDYATALDKWRPLAEQGSSAAQLFLGFMHVNGQSVPKDAAKAAYWYSEAAERDNMVAQVRLALMYRDGSGVAVDRAKALFWVKMAGRTENHMQKIAQALQRSLEAAMTREEIAAAERLFAKGADDH
ncbi:MAG: sel1 repeat family protein [Alphaproteobacteria bacterium]|nr:sel1 repeat family protein [Alphaproteobacteria bacterium]